jgi:hypothetical protein
MKNKQLSQIDREMNESLAHAKSPAERREIIGDANKKRKALARGIEVDAGKPIAEPTWITVAALPPGLIIGSGQIQWLKSSQFGGLTWEFNVPKPIDKTKLDALKMVQPHKVTRPVPDLVEVITAWRAWGFGLLNGAFRLKALGKDTLWEPKQQFNAICMAGGQHHAPAFNCSCGIWSFKELDGLVEAIGGYSEIKVLGKVSLWGRVIETENGYRAQYAYPSELWLLDDSLEELGLIYDVPVRTAAS